MKKFGNTKNFVRLMLITLDNNLVTIFFFVSKLFEKNKKQPKIAVKHRTSLRWTAFGKYMPMIKPASVQSRTNQQMDY